MNALPSPLPVDELDYPIVLEIHEGQVDTSMAHLPARFRRLGHEGNVVQAWDGFDAPPATWESACGLARGWVYNRGGVLADIPVCLRCEEATG